MNTYGYKRKTKPANWLSTPKGRVVAARNLSDRAAHAEALERSRRERRKAAGQVAGRSVKMERAMAEYRKERLVFLLEPEHVTCWACEMTVCVPARRSEDVHHTRGRAGKLLRDRRYWVALCREHHDRVQREPNWARALGLLPEKGQWNTVPK